MNCVPRDIALVVRADAFPQCLGMVVRVTELDRTWDTPHWHTEVPVVIGGHVIVMDDMGLRPLRDNPGEDEILRIAGRPKETADDRI